MNKCESIYRGPIWAIVSVSQSLVLVLFFFPFLVIMLFNSISLIIILFMLVLFIKWKNEICFLYLYKKKHKTLYQQFFALGVAIGIGSYFFEKLIVYGVASFVFVIGMIIIRGYSRFLFDEWGRTGQLAKDPDD